MSANPGLLVIDNNCYKDLRTPDAQSRFRRHAEMCDLTPAPSTVNLAESICAPAARRRLNLAAMKSVMGTYPLLPWPFDMLLATGRHLVEGGPFHGYGETGFEWMLDEPDAAGESSAHTHAELIDAENKAKQRFDAHRRTIQRRAKELNIRGQWEGARAFLDYWWEGEMAPFVAQFLWKQLSLPGEPPLNALLGDQTWRFMIDVEAMLMYGRCVAVDPAGAVGYVDLIQLLYLSIRRKRVLVTNDGSFFRAAEVILGGRYENARVVKLAGILN
jgi:hypothetical protein